MAAVGPAVEASERLARLARQDRGGVGAAAVGVATGEGFGDVGGLHRPRILAALRLAAVGSAVVVLAGCGGGGEGGSQVEDSLRDHLSATGVGVKAGSCEDGWEDAEGQPVWDCVVLVPKTAVSPATQRHWIVYVDGGRVVDALPRADG